MTSTRTFTIIFIATTFVLSVKTENVNTTFSSISTVSVTSESPLSPYDYNVTSLPDEGDSEEGTEDSIMSDEEEDVFRIPQDAVEFMDYFDSLIRRVQNSLEGVFEQYLPQLFEMSSTVHLTPECTYDIVRVLLALREMKPWAIKLLDASGKVPEGILSGTLSSLGAYDECLETTLGEDTSSDRKVTGQYCSIDIKPFLPPKPPSNSLNRVFNEAADAKGFPKKDHFSRLAPIFYFLKFRLGVCVPSSCTTADVNTITEVVSLKLRLNVTASRCEVKESFYASYEEIIAGAIFLSIIVLVVAASVVDLTRRYFPSLTPKFNSTRVKSLINKCCMSFSACKNFPSVLTSQTPDHAIRSIYGLKVINLIWIILAHSYLTLDLKAVGRLLQTQKINSMFIFQVVMNASLAVETFFFITGLLVTLSVFRRLERKPGLSIGQWIWFYVHRLVRMTPAVVLVMAVVLSAYKFSDGPLWREIIYPSAERCRKYWWIHLLHISNFFDVSRMCFLHLWYISADIQLFMLTPLVLFTLSKKPFFGRCLILSLTLLSVVSTGVITFLDHLPPTLIFDNPDPLSRKPFGNRILVKPYPHAAPYLIGILTGYFLHLRPDFKLNKRITFIGWTLSTSAVLCMLFITWQWNQGYPPSLLFGAVYAAVFRALWAISMAWVVIACHCGRGGFMASILGWSPFIPMSRVSYTAYLIHPGLMYVFVASTRNLFMFSHFLVIYLFLSHLLATFLASFILTLVIEVPFIRLEEAFYSFFFSSRETKGENNQKFYYSVNPPLEMSFKSSAPTGLSNDFGSILSPPTIPHPELPFNSLSLRHRSCSFSPHHQLSSLAHHPPTPTHHPPTPTQQEDTTRHDSSFYNCRL